jgi:hypothetical protein
MTLLKYLRMICLITIVAFIYIHMQMQIFDLAYQGKQKERHVAQLNDDMRYVQCSILKLKSSDNLGYALLENNNGLQFIDTERVVKLSIPQQAEIEAMLVTSKKLGNHSNPVFRFLSFISPAEARIERDRFTIKP